MHEPLKILHNAQLTILCCSSIVGGEQYMYMHMTFILVPDGLIWHKSPTSGPSRVFSRDPTPLPLHQAINHMYNVHMKTEKFVTAGRDCCYVKFPLL